MAKSKISKMIIKMWRQEWTVEGFTLQYETPEHFTRCHWQKVERVMPMWVVYRALMALYFVLSFLYTVIPIGHKIEEENRAKYLIFLTHWTYVLEVTVYVLGLVIVVMKVVEERKDPTAEPMDKMPWYYQMYWIFYTITVSSALVVSFIFWSFVYDKEKHPANTSCLFEHLFNSVFIIIDFWLVGHPVKFLHFYFPVFYGTTYIIFSIIYQMCGGHGVKGEESIYKILNWHSPGSAVLTCIFTFIFYMIIHFFYCCFSVCKFVVKRDRS